MPQRAASKRARRIAQRGGAVRDVARQVRVRRPSPRGSARSATRRTPRRCRRSRGGSSARRPRPAASGSSESPQRPMPVSSFRCTRTPRGISSDETTSSSCASRAWPTSRFPAGPMTMMRAVGNSRAEREPLRHGRDAERGRAGAERGTGDVGCAVAVCVRLDDRPELRTVERAEQRARRCGAAPRGRW